MSTWWMLPNHFQWISAFKIWLEGSNNFEPPRLRMSGKAYTPGAIDDPRRVGFPCFGKHLEGKTKSNQYAVWTSCSKCAMRMSYTSKEKGHGQTRQMGPDPHILNLALQQLESEMQPEDVTADKVNGKLMEVKGKLLQVGVPTPLALNMTLEEYQKRLERHGRADGAPVSTCDLTKDVTPMPAEETKPLPKHKIKPTQGQMLEEFAKNQKQPQRNAITLPTKVKKEPKTVAADVKATFGEDVAVISSEEEIQGSGQASGH